MATLAKILRKTPDGMFRVIEATRGTISYKVVDDYEERIEAIAIARAKQKKADKNRFFFVADDSSNIVYNTSS